MNGSLNKFFKSFVHAMRGIMVAVSDQQNLKIHVGVAIAVVGAGFFFRITAVEWCLILLAIALVIGLEMMNSAAENLVDLVTRKYDPLAGKVKDIAAGAVLFASIIAVIIGVMIFGKYLLA